MVADPSWRLEGNADFNHDRETDFAWRNFATGVNVVWFMKGDAVASQKTFMPVPSPSRSTGRR